jgi:hypothetical protein
MKKSLSLIFALGLLLAGGAYAAEPSLHEVYQAVHDGRLGEAQSMMNQVLKDHPDSAKAHYVEAEVLVRMGRAEDARGELSRAEALQPGLPFARPEAVRDLRGLINERGSNVRSVSTGAPAGESFPWVPVLIIGGVIFVFVMVWRMQRAAAVQVVQAPGPMAGPGGYGPGYAPGYGAAPYAGGPFGGGGGLGSSIVGGLATGAAVGAGMVAGEALANNLMGHHDQSQVVRDDAPVSNVSYGDGGRDFGVSDAGSWDSGGGDFGGGGGGGGGGDWS